MTIEDIRQFMRDYPGYSIPLSGGGEIHPQSAIELLSSDPGEVIDILKQREAK